MELVPQPKETKALVEVGERGMVPRSLDAMWRVADLIIRSRMAPPSLDSKEKVVIAMQMGMEVGLSLMQSIQSIAVINGKPSIYGDAGLALVRSSGLLENYEERTLFDNGKIIRGEDIDGYSVQISAGAKVRGVTAIAWRKGQKTPIARTFTLQQAREAGLLGRTDVWKKYTERMLRWRAVSWCLRDGFGDVLGGLAFAEEQEDIPAPKISQTEEPVDVTALLSGASEHKPVAPPAEESQENAADGPEEPEGDPEPPKEEKLPGEAASGDEAGQEEPPGTQDEPVCTCKKIKDKETGEMREPIRHRPGCPKYQGAKAKAAPLPKEPEKPREPTEEDKQKAGTPTGINLTAIVDGITACQTSNELSEWALKMEPMFELLDKPTKEVVQQLIAKRRETVSSTDAKPTHTINHYLVEATKIMCDSRSSDAVRDYLVQNENDIAKLSTEKKRQLKEMYRLAKKADKTLECLYPEEECSLDCWEHNPILQNSARTRAHCASLRRDEGV